MEQKQLTNLTLTAGVIAVYLRIIFCAVVVILTLYNMTQWKNLRKIDLLLNFLWFLWAGWSVIYLVMNRL